ncbi:acyl-CoA mutase large subunit family protein, partial [bacterium]|nr:acyl-CoA mutase large subunit family protein [bacterium]
MDKQNDGKGLMEEFAVPTYDEWLALVNEQLKGAPFDKKLVTQTVEGISIQPIYLRKDIQELTPQLTPPGQYPFIRGTKASGNTSRSWAVSQLFQYPTAEQFNEAACRDISNGLTSLQITLDEAGRSGHDPDQSSEGVVGHNGLSIITRHDLVQALKGIDLAAIQVQLEGGMTGGALLLFLLEYLHGKKTGFASLRGNLVFDPLAELAARGTLPADLGVIFDRMAHLARISGQVVPGFKTLGIDARPYNDGGGSAAQELGYAMATAVTIFRELLQRGLAVDEIAPAVSFNFATGSDFFLEIAKLRAARYLWARIVSQLGGSESSQKATLHAMSSRYNKTVHDPYVNMLRTTTEAFSSVLGGTDVLTVTPFDDLFGLPDEMSRRVARNLQIVLREECRGNRVIDPAGGSWFVESLTDQLGRQAWDILQSVEKSGGMAAAIKGGDVQNAIAAVDQ